MQATVEQQFLALSMKVDEVEEYNNLGNLQQHLMAFYAFLVLCTNVDEV